MNKTFRVYFEKGSENYWHDLPTREEAEAHQEELTNEGYIVTASIEEIRL